MSDHMIGEPDMSHRCTCATEAICHLHPNGFPSNRLWREQAYHKIIDLQRQLDEANDPFRNVEVTCPWCNQAFVTAAPIVEDNDNDD